MKINYLKSCLNRNFKLGHLYPRLKGRHTFFNEHITEVNERIEMLEDIEVLSNQGKEYLKKSVKMFVNISKTELKNVQSIFSTSFGNAIQESEYEVYSITLDAFQND